MPTYEYECINCGYRFEVFQKITAEPLKGVCPKCSLDQLKRLIGSGGGIIFRGPGFYATDYRSKDYRKKEKEETKPKSSTTPKEKDT